jgi:hypothetical protein
VRHIGYHNVHAGGMEAMLQIENTPLSLLGAGQSGHPLFQGSAKKVKRSSEDAPLSGKL